VTHTGGGRRHRTRRRAPTPNAATGADTERDDGRRHRTRRRAPTPNAATGANTERGGGPEPGQISESAILTVAVLLGEPVAGPPRRADLR
jgi:hypothetical protein